MGDEYIITGMSSILNSENIKPGVDLKDLERQMVNKGFITKTDDPQDKLSKELNNTAKMLGINLSDDASDNNDDGETFNLNNVSNDTFARKPTVQVPEQSWTSKLSSERKDYSLDARTNEKERRHHIDSVMGDMTGFSFEKEKQEDIKIAMLSEIDSLIFSLGEEDVDLSRIPQVTRHSSFEDVESVLKNLRHKNDHLRYCSFAEEFMMFTAHALEDLFDGKKTWFGKYKPDLTGWHNHVNVKLRRMRHDTGQLVSGIMSDYNVGPTARIMFELVPSMILYSRTRKTQYNKANVNFNDSDIDAAKERIRSFNTTK